VIYLVGKRANLKEMVLSMSLSVDHIDPEWTEGRNYQLVCGLDNTRNREVREVSFNVKKGNRFLPWRYCPEEVGKVPQELGDWCQFLDPDTGEWVLAEFLGDWWVEKTHRYDARRQPRKPRPDLVARNLTNNPSKKGLIRSKTHRENLSKALAGKPKSEEAKANMRKPKNLSPEQRAQRSALSTAVAAATKRNDQGQFTK
jgi:hypothetical protein